ncbi:MAG: MFS transporter [Ilumatobacteraceae bacterium]
MTSAKQATAPATRLPAAYWRLWSASTISNLGDGIFLVALPLLAAQLTTNAISISLVATFAGLPWLVLSLPIGAIIDRLDRRRLLVQADAFRTVLVGILAVLVAGGHARIWMLWLLAAGLGTAEVVFDNASQAILPAIVAPHQLEKANGLRYSAEVTANIFVGTPIGSVLFTLAVWLPFAADSASFLLAVMLVATLRGSFKVGQVRPTASLSRDVRTGLSWLWKHRLLRGLAVALGITNFGFQMSQGVFVLFAKERLHITDTQFGLMLSAIGVGAIIGGLVGDRIVARLGKLAVLYSAVVVWALALVAVGLWPVAWFVTVVSAIEALAATVWNVVTVSLRQQIVPEALFGRVNSVYRWFGWGTIPIGAIAGGQVAHLYGLRAPYFVGAGFVLLAMIVLMRTVTPKSLASSLSAAESDQAPSSPDSDTTPVYLERDPMLWE